MPALHRSSCAPRLIVTSRVGATRLLCGLDRGPAPDHVVSICDPSEPPPIGLDAHPARTLRLEMQDMHALREPWRLDARPPCRADMATLLAFCESIGPDALTLIHCAAGVSRSTAAALTLLAARLGPGAEDEATRALLALRPLAMPNRLMVALADDLLARDGALIAACARAFPTPLRLAAPG